MSNVESRWKGAMSQPRPPRFRLEEIPKPRAARVAVGQSSDASDDGTPRKPEERKLTVTSGRK